MLKIYNLNDSIKNCFSEKNKNIINKTNIKDEFTQNLYKILLDKTNKINNEKIKFFQSKNFI